MQRSSHCTRRLKQGVCNESSGSENPDAGFKILPSSPSLFPSVMTLSSPIKRKSVALNNAIASLNTDNESLSSLSLSDSAANSEKPKSQASESLYPSRKRSKPLRYQTGTSQDDSAKSKKTRPRLPKPSKPRKPKGKAIKDVIHNNQIHLDLGGKTLEPRNPLEDPIPHVRCTIRHRNSKPDGIVLWHVSCQHFNGHSSGNLGKAHSHVSELVATLSQHAQCRWITPPSSILPCSTSKAWERG